MTDELKKKWETPYGVLESTREVSYSEACIILQNWDSIRSKYLDDISAWRDL